jgi:hypothetical protein
MKKHLALFLILSTFSLINYASAQQKVKKMARPTLAIDNSAVDMIYNAMKNSYGDDSKMIVIRDAIKNNTDGITVAQELRLLNQFSNDDAKLTCAKFLYPWCVDYKNYDKIQYNMSTPAGQKAVVDFLKKQGSK